MSKSNFGITTINGKTTVDLTTEITLWCTRHNISFKTFNEWLLIAMNISTVKKRITPRVLIVTEDSIKLTWSINIPALIAYNEAQSFLDWYCERIEDNIFSIILRKAMEPHIKP
jgi:hypothetical protein